MVAPPFSAVAPPPDPPWNLRFTLRAPTRWAVAVAVGVCCVGEDELDDELDDDEEEDDEEDDEEEEDDEPMNEADEETPLEEELGDGEGVDGVGDPLVMVAPTTPAPVPVPPPGAPLLRGLPAGLL